MEFAPAAFYVWAALSGLVLLQMSWKHWQFGRQIQLLSDVEIDPATKWPSISLIVPACNEALTIGPALQSLLRIDYSHLEIIVVNDRSQDGTGGIVRDMQAQHKNLRLVNVTELPAGWLGKVHALYQGVQRAQSDWLLFSDADIHYEKDSLKKAMSAALAKDVDFFTIVPGVRASSWLLRPFIIQFTQILTWALSFKSIEDPTHTQAIGIGAFSLVKRQVYEASPGFEWLRLEIIDDGGLAFMLKSHGAKIGLVSGLGEIELEWYSSVWQFVKGLEKNSFSVFQFSYLAAAANALLTWLIFGGIFYAPLATGDTRAVGAMLLCLTIYLATAYPGLKRLIPFHLSAMIFGPLAQGFFPFISLRAAVLFWWRGGIWWRGTFYSRNELVAHQRLKVLDQLRRPKFPKKEQSV